VVTEAGRTRLFLQDFAAASTAAFLPDLDPSTFVAALHADEIATPELVTTLLDGLEVSALLTTGLSSEVAEFAGAQRAEYARTLEEQQAAAFAAEVA
jgi:uncharacterized protein (DUF58 family)